MSLERNVSTPQQLTTATLAPVPARHVEDVPVAKEMSDSFLAYALSVITSRAIPDVRDGLKPVQRRVLWSMLQMGLRPGTPYRKAARVVGDTMGRYHPHGDAAIYDTLVRMGQDFSRMVTLVDPQGNFGSLDDPPAAARYTECRLSEAAMDMVGELDEDTVDFRPTYDGEDSEPAVLPAALPNLLVNGTAGIAVGMATNMLPHNLAEIAEAIELVMSKQPSLEVGSGEQAASQGSAIHHGRKRRGSPRPRTDELMAVVPGPDFPGGGVVLVDDGLRKAYETGRGSVRVRARTGIEQVTRRRKAIIVTELPHLVGPERVVTKISELANSGRLPEVAGVADLTGMEGLRLQIDLKPDAEPSAVLAELYRLTPLEETVSVNNVVLVNGVPTTVGLRELCEQYVIHRLEVIIRRTHHRRRQAEKRLEIVLGLLVALDNIDEVVALIRRCHDVAEAHSELKARFGLTDIQSSHILDMPLRRLTALERRKLDEEEARLRSDIEDYTAILASDRRRRNIVRRELRRIVKDHGCPRRAHIVDAEAADRALSAAGDTSAGEAQSVDTGVPSGRDVPCVVTLSTSGNLGRMPLSGARRGVPGRHDLISSRVTASTASRISAVTSEGRAFAMFGGEVAEASNRVRGSDATAAFGLGPKEKVMSLVSASHDKLVLVTSRGSVRRLEADEVLRADSGAQLVALSPGDRVVSAFMAPEEVDIVIAADDGRALRMASSSVRIQRPGASGVAGLKLVDGAVAVGAGAVLGDAVLVHATSSNGVKSTYCAELPTQGRGSQGVLVVKLAAGETVTFVTVGADTGMLALMGRDDNPRRIDPVPVPFRDQPTPRYRAATKGERRVHVVAPGRW